MFFPVHWIPFFMAVHDRQSFFLEGTISLNASQQHSEVPIAKAVAEKQKTPGLYLVKERCRKSVRYAESDVINVVVFRNNEAATLPVFSIYRSVDLQNKCAIEGRSKVVVVGQE